MKAKTVFTIIITAVFFAGMVFLTFSARAIHNAKLPKVMTKKLSYEYFPYEYTDENGETQTGMKVVSAIETVYLEGDIYVLYQEERNGENRDHVRLVTLDTGSEKGKFTEVYSGLSSGQKFVSECDGELYDGCEVFILDKS